MPTHADQGEAVEVPFLRSAPPARAPASDPYLRPDTITVQALSYGGVEIPPILSGIQPGHGLEGEPVDYPVSVVWANRRQIDSLLDAVACTHPDTSTVVDVVRSYIIHLDSMRDQAKLGALLALGGIKPENPESLGCGRANLQKVIDQLGTWNDERRLHLRVPHA